MLVLLLLLVVVLATEKTIRATNAARKAQWRAKLRAEEQSLIGEHA
jgi:hypothetical protein